MLRVTICRVAPLEKPLKIAALWVAAIGLLCAPADLLAQSRNMERLGTVLQTVLPLARAFCAYRENDINDYSMRFVGDAAHPYGFAPHDAMRFTAQPRNSVDQPGDLGFIAGHEAAVSGAEYLNETCISGLPDKVVVGGLAAVATAPDFAYKETEIGVFSLGALAGFNNDKFKFKVSRHSVKLRFSLDF